VSVHQVHIFISHSWSYSHHYQTLDQWVFGYRYRFGQASVDFRNYSIPLDDPVHTVSSDRALQAAIYRHMARSHVIIIPTAMYTMYSRWILKELDGADRFAKPVLAVDPWGQLRRSSIVLQRADDHTGWNRVPLVNKLWYLYREYYG
jgi:hypothetical protein